MKQDRFLVHVIWHNRNQEEKIFFGFLFCLNIICFKEGVDMNKKKLFKIVVTVAVLVALVIDTYNSYALRGTYEKAEKQIENAEYSEALETLISIEKEDYLDTTELISLCEMHIYYEEGNVQIAYTFRDEILGEHQNEKQQKEISNFITEVEEAYVEYIEKKNEQKEARYRAKIQYGIPFVGMYEKHIGVTKMGKPDPNVKKSSVHENGETYKANIYEFKDGENIIFTATCAHGMVVEISDYRDNPIKPYKPSHSSSSKNNRDDPYEVYDYDDPEDFYYDYEDDFEDFEDAEDYWDDAWD